jgi:NAD dependent epimerase/dehydratase family enzyme
MPAWVVEWLFGQMGREAMLSSARVKPSRLVEAGFVFRQAELEPALREVLAGGGKE